MAGVLLPGMALAQSGWMPSAPHGLLERKPDGLLIVNPWNLRGRVQLGEKFRIELADGRKIAASEMTKAGTRFRDPATGLEAEWSISSRRGSHYARMTLTLRATGGDVDVRTVVLLEGSQSGEVVGTVPGSPVVVRNEFFGIEHPMSESQADEHGWSCRIRRKIPLRAGQAVTYTAVAGAAPEGQMRRAVLAYLEAERPRKYDPFLHYNSWYDLGFFTKYTANECVERINTFANELAAKRGAPLKSFLFDDGWDDTSTVWKFHSGFPDGFAPLKAAAERVGADPGIWLSPWGGYGKPRQERLTTGKAAGMEIDGQGYALSGPKYFERFRDVTLDLVRRYGINQFKFDGTGSPDKQYPGSRFASDFEAAISLISDLRAARKGLFINLTTGTWPSPFWTRYADSIWRGGSDHEFAGVGPWREKWITYRDGDTYHGVVQRGPFYPLNSLMLHGLIYAQHARNLQTDPDGAFSHEVQSYFGTGTQLQEMYITPSLLSSQNWDELAAAAKWSKANADVLVDTHWVGGDPTDLDVYGWASWSPRKAILTLRNPSDKPQAFSVEPERIFELPPRVHGTWDGKSRFGGEDLKITVGSSKVVVLQPFEVRTFEGAIR